MLSVHHYSSYHWCICYKNDDDNYRLHCFAGAFLTISLPDLYRYVKQLNAEANVPNTAGDYSQWKKLPVTQNEYVHEIYRSVPLAVIVITVA